MGPSFSYSSDLSEYLAVSSVVRLRLFPRGIRLVMFAVLIVPVVILIIGVAYLWRQARPDDHALLPVGIGLLLGFLWLRIVSPIVNRWSITRLASSIIVERDALKLSLEDGGVRYVTSSVDSFIAWRGVDQIFVRNRSLCFVAGLGAYYFPARCFATEADRAAAIAFALPRLRDDARSRSRV